jgi:8-oxo-dGTP diphosphatase
MKAIKFYLQEATNSVVSAKAIITDEDGKILILRRTDDLYEGLWDLPGGHIEENETKEDALKREVHEETTLEIDNIKSVKTITCNGHKVAIFTAKAKGLDVELHKNFNPDVKKPEHSEYRWLTYKDELERSEMCDQLKEVIMNKLKERRNP